jgi:hypothetical protein
LHYAKHVWSLLTHRQEFPLDSISIETLTGTQGISDNEPKVPNHVRHKGEGDVYPRTGHEHPDDEQMYSSNIYFNSAVHGVVSSTPRPGRFTPEKDPVPIV